MARPPRLERGTPGLEGEAEHVHAIGSSRICQFGCAGRQKIASSVDTELAVRSIHMHEHGIEIRPGVTAAMHHAGIRFAPDGGFHRPGPWTSGLVAEEDIGATSPGRWQL